jgi:outer membrane protein TolC
MKTFPYCLKPLLSLSLLLNTFPLFADAIPVDQFVVRVLQANPQIDIAQATWRAVVENAKQKSSLDDPQIHYNFAPLTIDSRQTGFGQRIDISQRVPFFGKLSTRTQAAEYLADAQQHTIQSVQLLLVNQAKGLFADWYFIHQAIQVNQAHKPLLVTLQKNAVNHYRTGKGRQQAILHIEGEQVQLAHHLIVLQRQQKTILAQINTLLNRPTTQGFPVPKILVIANKLPPFEQLQQDAIQSRPEIKAVNAQIKMYKTQEELAELDYYPDVKFSIGYNSLWKQEDKRFNVGVSVNIPLDQSKRQAAEREAKAKTQKAHWQYVDLQATINQDVATAYANAEESLHVLHLYQQTLLPLAKKSLALAKIDYQTGKDELVNLITYEKKYLQAQLASEQAKSTVFRHFAQLEWVMGRGDLSRSMGD